MVKSLMKEVKSMKGKSCHWKNCKMENCVKEKHEWKTRNGKTGSGKTVSSDENDEKRERKDVEDACLKKVKKGHGDGTKARVIRVIDIGK